VSPKTGEFFYKSDEDKLYRWNGSAWTSAVSTGDLVGTVDGSTFIIDGTIVASKIGAAEINSTHVGSNLLITNTANIGMRRLPTQRSLTSTRVRSSPETWSL
jgi:hypothetical protein